MVSGFDMKLHELYDDMKLHVDHNGEMKHYCLHIFIMLTPTLYDNSYTMRQSRCTCDVLDNGHAQFAKVQPAAEDLSPPTIPAARLFFVCPCI